MDRYNAFKEAFDNVKINLPIIKLGQKVYDGFKAAADQIKPALKKQCEDDAKAKHKPHSHNPHSHNPHSHNPHSHNPHSHNPHKHNPHPHTKPSYSNYRGGNGGGAVNSYCSGKTYINYWKIRSGVRLLDAEINKQAAIWSLARDIA